MVDKDVPTFRLPLTTGTIDAMKTKIAEYQNLIDLYEHKARNVEFS
ncbi:hypothetical protein [Sphingobacterium sp. T2]|nr:hypothetical protein [Sphingobacterium sp. T2]